MVLYAWVQAHQALCESALVSHAWVQAHVRKLDRLCSKAMETLMPGTDSCVLMPCANPSCIGILPCFTARPCCVVFQLQCHSNDVCDAQTESLLGPAFSISPLPDGMSRPLPDVMAQCFAGCDARSQTEVRLVRLSWLHREAPLCYIIWDWAMPNLRVHSACVCCGVSCG